MLFSKKRFRKCFIDYYLYNFNCYIDTFHNSTSYLYFKKNSCGQSGKILCIIIIALCIISWILTLIFFIITMKDYTDKESDVTGDYFSGGDWAAIIIPCIFALIVLILMALCANYLYKTFTELCETSSFPVNQITESNNHPNIAKPGMFPNNAPGLAVNIQQSEANK